MKRVQDTSYFDVLSVRVTLLAAKGLANKAIARELNITEGTIKLHLHKVHQKLGIKGRLALLVEASDLPPATEARILPLCQSDNEGQRDCVLRGAC